MCTGPTFNVHNLRFRRYTTATAQTFPSTIAMSCTTTASLVDTNDGSDCRSKVLFVKLLNSVTPALLLLPGIPALQTQCYRKPILRPGTPRSGLRFPQTSTPPFVETIIRVNSTLSRLQVEDDRCCCSSDAHILYREPLLFPTDHYHTASKALWNHLLFYGTICPA